MHHGSSSVVVAAAQPFFLIMTAFGTLVMASTLIPLSFDDGGDIDSLSESDRTAMCMSIPWLAFTGFSIVFSALFAKTWRINRLVERSDMFGRVKVDVIDVLGPFGLIMLCNIIVLTVWTVVDPLVYTRSWDEGTDFWNREISSSGSCECENAAAYLVPLGLINAAVVSIAVWQAIRARNIKSEFSESKYIGLSVFSMAQAFLTGIPIVAVVRDIPQAFYLVLTFLIFLLSMVVLLLIFLPKMMMQRRYSGLSKADQRKLISMAMSVRRNSIKAQGAPGEPSALTASAFLHTTPVQAIRNGSSQYMSSHDRKSAGMDIHSSLPIEHRDSDPDDTLPKEDQPTEKSVQFSIKGAGGSDKDAEPASTGKTNAAEEKVVATALFQQMVAINSKSSTNSLEAFLSLVDRNKLNEQEQSALDDVMVSLQATVSA